jgi:hypothetical protein
MNLAEVYLRHRMGHNLGKQISSEFVIWRPRFNRNGVFYSPMIFTSTRFFRIPLNSP